MEEVPPDRTLDTRVRRKGSRYVLIAAAAASLLLVLALASRLLN
jgi:hypothetical protein